MDARDDTRHRLFTSFITSRRRRDSTLDVALKLKNGRDMYRVRVTRRNGKATRGARALNPDRVHACRGASRRVRA